MIWGVLLIVVLVIGCIWIIVEDDPEDGGW